MSKLLPVDLETQKGSLWLKAFRVLDACIKGVQPFVGLVMQRLHLKVIAIVKANVICDTGECADDDWDCSCCKQADGEAHFTEDWPLVLKICSIDTFGVAELASPHHLKPHVLMPCILKGIPAGCFHDSERISPKTRMFFCRNPADPADNADFKSSSVVLLRASDLDSTTHHCHPFHVTRCFPTPPKDPELQFYAVLCSSGPAHTKRLVVDPETPAPPGLPLFFAFWALKLRNFEPKHEFEEFKHGLKEGDVLRFSGELPPEIVQGSPYIVTNASSFSFQVSGPILRPVMSLTTETVSVLEPFVITRTSPVGR
jgi:hypothetical protein